MKKKNFMLIVFSVILVFLSAALPCLLEAKDKKNKGNQAAGVFSMDEVLNPDKPAEGVKGRAAGAPQNGIVKGGKGAANLREKPEGTIIGEVKNGTVVVITGEKDGWYKVDSGKKSGYIRKDHIKKDGSGDEPDGGGGNAEKIKTTPPFKAGMKGYTAFRAPALVVTGRGTVLAFCEGRVDGHQDEGNMDVVMRRSTDSGRSWEDMRVIEDDEKNPCKVACPVVLPSGRILVVWCWNKFIKNESERTTRRVFVTYSDDDGKTWAKSREITSSVYRKDWRWYGTGPCHAIVKAREPHKGRIIVPARHNFEDRSQNMLSHIIYSDDGGDSWHIGGDANLRSSESTVVELSDGQIMLNSRNQSGKSDNRVVSLSKDGGNTFYKSYVDNALIEPRGCQASLLNHSFNSQTGKCNIIFSNPNHAADRTNGTLRLSGDDGATWTKSYRYSDDPPTFSGYSDIALINGGDIAVLFEKGGIPDSKKDRYDMIDFKIVKLSQLK